MADAISLIFLTMGALFLLKFALKFGSEKVRKYLISMSALIVIFAIFHEGIEIVHGFYNIDLGLHILFFTVISSTPYFIIALLLKIEITNLIKSGVKKNGG